MVTRRNEPGAQEDAEFMAKFIQWFTSIYNVRFITTILNRQCACGREHAIDMQIGNMYTVFESFDYIYNEYFVDHKISFPNTLLNKFAHNLEGKGNMCPYYVAQCTIDANYIYGQRHTTQAPIFALYNAKKEEIGVGDDYDMQHLDMAKRATIIAASLEAWFIPGRVPVTLRHYLPYG
jgi:hypothetical protein